MLSKKSTATMSICAADVLGEESQEEKRLKTSISDNKLVHVVSKWSKTE